MTGKHHFTEGALADRFYDLVVLLFQGLAHVLETLLLGAATLHTNNLFITRKQIRQHYKGEKRVDIIKGKSKDDEDVSCFLLCVQMSIIIK